MDAMYGQEKKKKVMLNPSEVSSMFQLKNELLRKKYDMEKNNLTTRAPTKGGLKIKGESQEKTKDGKPISQRPPPRTSEETEQYNLSKRRLEEKSKVYEKMKSGEYYNDDDECLIDFNKKSRYERSRAEEQDEEQPGPSIDPVLKKIRDDEEQRVYGVSHMRLSLNKEEHQKQIQEILETSKQLDEARAKRKIEQDAKEEIRKAKLAKLRAGLGLPEEKKEEPIEVPLDSIPLPEEPKEEPKLPKKNREWDEGKDRSHSRWLKAQRDKRDDDFRPPEFY